MNLHGWRQLCEWSIKYSCLSDEEKELAYDIYNRKWQTFCEWIVSEYGEYAASLGIEVEGLGP